MTVNRASRRRSPGRPGRRGSPRPGSLDRAHCGASVRVGTAMGALTTTVKPCPGRGGTPAATGERPDPTWPLQQAQRLVGFALMQLAPQRGTARLAERGHARWIPAGTAKGSRQTRPSAVLAGRGARQAIVAIGGDVAAGDVPPGTGRAGRIGNSRAARPGSQRGAAAGEAAPRGDLLVRRRRAGISMPRRAFPHIVDPITGSAATGVA